MSPRNITLPLYKSKEKKKRIEGQTCQMHINQMCPQISCIPNKGMQIAQERGMQIILHVNHGKWVLINFILTEMAKFQRN